MQTTITYLERLRADIAFHERKLAEGLDWGGPEGRQRTIDGLRRCLLDEEQRVAGKPHLEEATRRTYGRVKPMMTSDHYAGGGYRPNSVSPGGWLTDEDGYER